MKTGTWAALNQTWNAADRTWNAANQSFADPLGREGAPSHRAPASSGNPGAGRETLPDLRETGAAGAEGNAEAELIPSASADLSGGERG